MTISEKSAYLKGLADGMKLDTEKAEGKLIAELIDLVGEVARTVEVLDDETATLADYVDELDRDLGDVEEYIFETEDDEYFDDDDDEAEYGEYDDDECDGQCDCCSGCDGEDEVYDITAEGMRCIMCDNCGDTICYDETLDPGELICPACHMPVAGKTEETEE